MGSALIAPNVFAEDPTAYELRTYTAEAGKLEALHDRFKHHSMEIFERHGMQNVGYWTPVDTPNSLIYLIAHDNREAAEANWQGFFADPGWQAAYAASIADGRLVANVESIFLAAADYSPPADPPRSDPRLFELRTYTTHPGKLDNLHTRFREHTMRIFEKHGMTNILYTVPIDDDLENTLVYIIAHDDTEAAESSWSAFAQDPEWHKVARESQVDGPILPQGGVKSQFMTPTEYSPIR